MSELLRVSKSLSTVVSFQMETLYSQNPPRVMVAAGPRRAALAAAKIPVTGFCLFLQEGKAGGVDFCSYR